MSFLKFNALITNTAKGVKDSIEFPVNTANMDKTKSKTRIKLRIEDVTPKKKITPIIHTISPKISRCLMSNIYWTLIKNQIVNKINCYFNKRINLSYNKAPLIR